MQPACAREAAVGRHLFGGAAFDQVSSSVELSLVCTDISSFNGTIFHYQASVSYVAYDSLLMRIKVLVNGPALGSTAVVPFIPCRLISFLFLAWLLIAL